MKSENQLELLINDIVAIHTQARVYAVRLVNDALVQANWEVGKRIVEDEQGGKATAEYGKKTLTLLSNELTQKLGKGYSRSNLQNMRLFYLKYPNCQTLSGKLTWSHYCELIYIEDESARQFYEIEAIAAGWGVKELKRQINTSLFERLLLSKGTDHKAELLALAQKGQIIEKPQDILKNPYIFEFLGIAEEKTFLESDLEKRLIRHIEDFLLELGKGFMYVGSQQRITIDNVHYYVDMVFYNKILRCYVLIDLKMGKLEHNHIGQMNLYLNYYKAEVNDEIDQAPIGIILCQAKNEVMVEYALGGLSNHIFASKYLYYIPEKETLIREIEKLQTLKNHKKP
ncbi:PDDEXK nuclease domain-containing protein [Hugenholtzia roseola]|uniref:PDDEXK nuclease domain-containing protein n=1 Tax=Hugenholtzia roseola TaxID=1002 RepID=UPI0005579D91|nr:PDDEXK nuclease domain-containing protein [Hugenholtzia roseola]